VTGFYHLVLGQGDMDSIQVRDVFQRSCRVGTFSQTYNKRAGTFIPGNFIVDRAGYTTPECPTYCGTGGTYTDLSTMEYECTYPNGVDQWNRQVHCFIRGGMYVTRLLDNVYGPSNNVADLLLFLLRKSSRVPEEQIDTVGLLAAATFTNVNGFWFNGVVYESSNLRDWMNNTLKHFLLRQTRVGGKESLKPLLPVNNDGTIKTTPVTYVTAFTEDHIIPDTFQISYTPLADRKPVCITVLWRQQDDLGIAVMRTTEIRYPGTAIDGPFEQHDLSSFCASENHAVKIGTYILSRRNHIKHRLQITVKPSDFNSSLAPGDIVRVRLARVASTGNSSVHDSLYEVDQIGKTLTGEVTLALTHFPVDDTLCSVVAKEVAAAVGAGLVLDSGLSAVTCDINDPGDTSVPADTSLDPEDWSLPDPADFGYNVPEIPEFGGDGAGGSAGAGAGGGVGSLDDIAGAIGYGGQSAGRKEDEDQFGGGDNDGLGGRQVGGDIYADPPSGIAEPGETLTSPPICQGATVTWYEASSTAPGGKQILGQGPTYVPTANDLNKDVFTQTTCPGGGDPITSGSVTITDGFIPTPTTVTVNVTTETYVYSGEKRYCSNDTLANAADIQSNTSSFSVTNVVSYKPLPTARVQTFVCTGPSQTVVKDYGVELKLADGSTVLVGARASEGDVFISPAVYGRNTTYYQVYLTFGAGIFLYQSPPVPDPPNPYP
jgi:hypothetical protein